MASDPFDIDGLCHGHETVNLVVERQNQTYYLKNQDMKGLQLLCFGLCSDILDGRHCEIYSVRAYFRKSRTIYLFHQVSCLCVSSSLVDSLFRGPQQTGLHKRPL